MTLDLDAAVELGNRWHLYDGTYVNPLERHREDCPGCTVLALAEEVRRLEAEVERLKGWPAANVAAKSDPFEGLPQDLADVLRDPTITIPRDHEIRLRDGRTLFEHLHEWRNAPSNTASALSREPAEENR